MSETGDLLADYAQNGSETAFRELVDRYSNLVYSTALRLVDGDASMAQDVSQTVFVDLARKADSLSRETTLGGWLHRHACFVASTALRSQRRRQLRERQALDMNLSDDHTAANLARIAPILDDAIDQLPSEDRAAVLLRFFEQMEFRAVGQALGRNEDAARMKVNRALDKLQVLLKARGVTVSAAGLGVALNTGAVTAAPPGMAAVLAGGALTGATVGVGAGVGTFLKIMTMTNLKFAFMGAVAAAVVAATPLIMQHQSLVKARSETDQLRQQVSQLESLPMENQRLSNLIAESHGAAKMTDDDARELIRLRGQVGVLRDATNQLTKALAAKTQAASRAEANDSKHVSDSDGDQLDLPPFVVNKLRLIDAAKQQWALERKPAWTDLQPYLVPGRNGGLDYLTNTQEGNYTIGAIGEKPKWIVDGHEHELPSPK